MNLDYLYNTSASDLRARFEKPLSAYPEFTPVEVNDGISTFTVEIPTAEVFTKGCWLARRFSGVTFSRVETWLFDHGYFPKTVAMRPSGVK